MHEEQIRHLAAYRTQEKIKKAARDYKINKFEQEARDGVQLHSNLNSKIQLAGGNRNFVID